MKSVGTMSSFIKKKKKDETEELYVKPNTSDTEISRDLQVLFYMWI